MPPRRTRSLLTRRPAAVMAALGVAVACSLSPASASASPTATARLRPAPVITAHMGQSIHLSQTNVRAGEVTFRAVTGHGLHELQIARLRHGYTLAQAGPDINKAFNGDVAAVRRVDNGVDFRGGAETRPTRAGRFTTFLGAGHYLVLDQDGPGLAHLYVHGPTVHRRLPHPSSSIGVFSYGFSVRRHIPRVGWTHIANVSDQPHFVEFIHIKASTTRAQVKRAFSSPSNSQPSWALPGGTGSGVLTNGRAQQFHYRLPAGKYVIACFWPDDDTGMPHAFMGMWKIIWLK